tara:strand:+ start:855 stop:1022 length:168 start_codon:yes stop_codon:yes gene_type:complete
LFVFSVILIAGGFLNIALSFLSANNKKVKSFAILSGIFALIVGVVVFILNYYYYS